MKYFYLFLIGTLFLVRWPILAFSQTPTQVPRTYFSQNGHDLSAAALARGGALIAPGFQDWAARNQDSLLLSDKTMENLNNHSGSNSDLLFSLTAGVNQNWIDVNEHLPAFSATLKHYKDALQSSKYKPDDSNDRKSMSLTFLLSPTFQLSFLKNYFRTIGTANRGVNSDSLIYQKAEESLLKFHINFRPYWSSWRIGWSLQPTLAALQLSLFEQAGFKSLPSYQFNIWENILQQNTQYLLVCDVNFHALVSYVNSQQTWWGLRLDADNLLSSPTLFNQAALSADWSSSGPQRDLRLGFFSAATYGDNRVIFNLEGSRLLSNQATLAQKMIASMHFELNDQWTISTGYQNGDVSLGAGLKYQLFNLFITSFRQNFSALSSSYKSSASAQGRTLLVELSVLI